MFQNYVWADAFENFLKSLQVMWQSMLGIFIVMIVLFISILVLSFISERSEKKKQLAEKEENPSNG